MIAFMKRLVKKILRMIGIDIIRYHEQRSDLALLREKNIRTVFDIGANIGQFAQEIRAELPSACLYSFEPIESCHQKLVRSMQGDKKFRAFKVALGDRKGTEIIHVSTYSPSSSLLPQSEELKKIFPHTKGTREEKISIERLDDIWKTIPHPDNILVKMDVQGFEGKVIDGGVECLRRASTLIIETSFVELYSGQPLFDDIYGKVRVLGFRYTGSLRHKKNPKTGEILSEDSVFVKE